MKASLTTCDAILLTSYYSRLYYSSFSSSAGYVLITKENTYLIVDFRYYEMAKNNKQKKYILLKNKNTIDETLINIINDLKINTLGFEENHLTVTNYEKLKTLFKTKKINLKLIKASKTIAKDRAIKTDEEITLIKKAQAITDKAFNYILGEIKPGITEKQIEYLLNQFITSNGAKTSFETIAISGKNTSLPHGKSSNKKLKSGEFLLIDYGACYNNYCSDMTRTVALGKPDDEMKKIYEIVLEANKRAINNIHKDQRASETDKTARDYISEKGYGKYFGHSLGHGVGLECHEQPTISQKNNDKILNKNIFTIEPGIYIPRKFGVRIEDIVYIDGENVINITNSEKKLIEI